MSFLETFTAVFTATLISQISIWLIERYIKSRWSTTADKVEEILKKMVKGER